MRKTKIVCTIGPASESLEILTELVKAGMNVARLNFSHGSHAEHLIRINNIKKVREELGVPLAIMLDTKGPEVRLGTFKNGKEELVNGQKFTLTTESIVGDIHKVSITYKDLPKEVKLGTKILIADGLIELQVIDIGETDVICEVVSGGTVGDKKNVNIPGATSKLPAITENDVSDLLFGIKNDVDFIAASFIRKAADVLEIRRILESKKAMNIKIISKIENQEGVDNSDEILRVSDGLMVARGDLGVEIATEEIPFVQKDLIKKCNKLGKPVITATQMLDSMIRNPRPTRAEVTDVANAILDGTDAIMLSGETAAGKFPVDSVKTMATIAKRTEMKYSYGKDLDTSLESNITITNAISHATCTTSIDLCATAIITPTKTGTTARAVSKFRPKAPILAATPDEKTCRTLNLCFGVYPMIVDTTDSTDELIEMSVNKAVESGFVCSGDLVVITAGVPVGVTGSTNLIKVHIVGEILAKGMGIGDRAYVGKVCIIKNFKEDVDKFEEGDILVAETTDIETVGIMGKASAIVVEEGGLTSHAAIVGLEMGVPVIVGVSNILEKFRDGQIVTVDAKTGVIYNGKSRALLR